MTPLSDQSLRLLLVEDNPGDRDLFVEYMELAGGPFEADFASSLGEALEMAQANEPDVILLDLGLPDSQGMETLVRVMERFPSLPVIALTGRDDDEIARQAIQKGAQDYLVKGKITPSQIFRSIRYSVSRKNIENELAAIYENAPILMMLMNEDRRIQRLNKIAAAFSGRSEADIRGLRGGDALGCVHSMENPQGCGYARHCAKCGIRRSVLHTLETGEPVRNHETRLPIDMGDENRELYLSISTTKIMLNKEPRILVAIQDVTERRQAEENLRRSEAFLSATGKMARVGGWELDARNLELRWTEVTYEIHETPLDYHPDLDKAFSFFHEEDRPLLEAAVHRALEEGVPYDLELRFITATGRNLWTHTKCFPVKENGKVVRLLGTFQDITERKKADEERKSLEEQVLQGQKMESIGRLAGGVAHDLNNLLTPILGYGEMMISDFAPDDERRAFAQQIYDAGLRAKDLVRQLLAFGRKQALEVRTLDLNQVLANFEKLLRRTIREDIRLKVIPHDGLPPIRADLGQIEQVIMNLAINAQDAMPSGGSLILETGMVELDEAYARNHHGMRPGPYVLMAVSDTGHGMDAQTRDKLFEPFFTTKEKGKGTGLGLATVYGIVKQHGGNIWVYSEPGKGATFKVYLPPAKGEPQALRKMGREQREIRGTETVMVAEDDPMVRNLAVNILRQQGYRVLYASSGRQCLEVLEGHEGPLDLLLTDVVMPEMNGKALYREVAERFPGIRVLYMSGYTENVILDQGVLEDRVDYLQKPFSVYGLAAKVREVLEREPGEANS